MNERLNIPANAEAAVHSVRWAIQSRAHEGDPWYTENDNTPGMPGAFEDCARNLLAIYRDSVDPGRKTRLTRRTTICYDEPVED